MQTITKYKADDGVEFLNASECELHEANCELAEAIMRTLPKKPDSCDFSNGGGYVQHDAETLLKARNRFLEFVKRYTDHKWIQQSIDGGMDIDCSWAGRIIGECAPSSIYKHWCRFGCVDKSFREWGQPYYALNPEQGKQIRLN